ncbi:MAG: pantoate--beta-alanine ligase [Bacteroidales bacterium]|nr:pantoate--beta-alanine ligase [Bacteroidales bacterium]
MLVVTTVEELKDVVFRIKSNGKSVGLVPTMGALHDGHLSLLKRAKAENEVVVCSIFVNPVQFNNPVDLEKYPRDVEGDLKLINPYVDVVFTPTAEEVFPEPPKEVYDFGKLDKVMEGAFRPGHFNGVGIIVKRLLDWTTPDKAYFGEKDFQQLVIIKHLVKQYQLKTQIVPCPIVREASGLAMSSRNQRLSVENRMKAANIYRILTESLDLKDAPVQEIKDFVINEINKIDGFKLDYFEIVDDMSLQPVEFKDLSNGIIGCIAVYVGDVRLIDNIRYK